jgi:hypothetical protein
MNNVLGCTMRNPYVQVALTYVRRWWSIRNCLILLSVIFVTSVCVFVAKDKTPPFLLLIFAVWTIQLFSGVASHIRQQFADARSHLTPGFRRVHVAVATAVILLVAVFLPAMLARCFDLRSVGLVALSLALFAAVLWLILLASPWLSGAIYVLLVIGLVALFSESFSGTLVQFAHGRFEPTAVAMLIAGIAATVLGIRRMARLNEDMPWYHGLTAGSLEQSRVAAERSANKSGLRPGLRERQEERRVARLIEHARQAPLSWWSGACRWQMMMPTGWSTWLIWLLATLVMLMVGTWTTKGQIGTSWNFVACLSLLLLPMVAIVGQFMQRKGIMSRELLLPVERGLYLRQIGTAAAVCQLQSWSAVTVATLFWWLVVVPESVSGSTIAGILAFSALSQIWLFAGAAWLIRHRRLVVTLGVLTSLAIGLLTPIVTDGFTAAPRLAEWQYLVWTATGFLTLLGAFLSWAAYRRWLVADFD